MSADATDPRGRFLKRAFLQVTDEEGRPRPFTVVPVTDSRKDTSEHSAARRVVVFFDEPISPEEGEFTVTQTRYVRGGLDRLRQEGWDTVGNRNIRQSSVIRRVEVVLYVPDSVSEISGLVSEDGPPVHKMKNREMKSYRRGAPGGFKTLGWYGEDIAPGVRFGVDLTLPMKKSG